MKSTELNLLLLGYFLFFYFLFFFAGLYVLQSFTYLINQLFQKYREVTSHGSVQLREIDVLKNIATGKDRAIERFFDFNPRDIAEQLTLLEYNVRIHTFVVLHLFLILHVVLGG